MAVRVLQVALDDTQRLRLSVMNGEGDMIGAWGVVVVTRAPALHAMCGFVLHSACKNTNYF